MRQSFLRFSLILSVLFALGASGAVASVDIAVERINTDRLQCGGCPGYVDVEVKNRGNSNLSGGYTVWVELRVVPAGDVHNDKTYKKSFQYLNAGQTKTITFDDIKIQSCYQVASTFSVKTYVTGGNLNEGNTRNNDKSISKPISRRCPGNGGGGNSGGGNGNSGGNRGNNQVDGADFLVWQIDVSKVKSGGCEGAVAVEIKNQGRKLSGGYTLWTELRVVPAGDVHNAKTYKKSFPAHDIETGGKKKVYFEKVKIQRTNQTASTFSVKIYLTGGNYREGNTRNNEKSISKPISRRCPSGGGSGGNGHSGNGNGGGNNGYGSADFEVYKIDTSKVRYGGCKGTVEVEIKNRGRKLSGGYTLWTELRVVPAGDVHNAKTYKKSFPTHEIESGGKKLLQFEIQIGTSKVEASSFEVKTYLTGGNYREGNTRNNKKRVSEVIRNRCPEGGSGQRGGNVNTGNPTGFDGNRYGAADFEVYKVDSSRVKYGGCQGILGVEIKNKGRKLTGGYTLWTEVRVVPAGDVHNAKTYKKSIPAHEIKSGGKSLLQFEIQIGTSKVEASSFEVKTYLTGGNYREGNTRNNKKNVSRVIRTRCTGGGGQQGGANYPSTTGGAKPDLYATYFRPSSTLCCGQKHDLKASIKNKGRVKIEEKVKLKLTRKISGEPDKNYYTSLDRGIVANRIESAKFRDVEIPCGVPTTFEMVIDPDGKIAEADERNNTRTSQVTFNRTCH